MFQDFTRRDLILGTTYFDRQFLHIIYRLYAPCQIIFFYSFHYYKKIIENNDKSHFYFIHTTKVFILLLHDLAASGLGCNDGSDDAAAFWRFHIDHGVGIEKLWNFHWTRVVVGWIFT